MNKHLDAQTCTWTDRRTDGLKHTPSRTRVSKHTNACIDERRLVRSNRTDGRTHTNALTHTRCTHVHTHGRTDIRTHVRTEANTQVQTWKLEVRSKKLEARSKKLEIRNAAHALMNARMCKQTFGRTNMHADR